MKRLSFSSLRIQLISLILLAMVPIAALMLYTDMVERRAAVTHVRKDVMRIADLAIIDEAQLVKDIRQFLITLSHFPQIQSGKPAECNALLKDLLGHRQRYANLGVIKPNGTLYCSALPFSGSINLVDRAYFQRAVKMNDFSIGEYQVGRVTGKCTINFAYPLLDDSGMIKRIVYAALDLSWLNYKFEYQIEKELPKGSTLTKIDSNGVVLVRYPDPEEWIGRKIERQPDLEKQILENKKGLLEARGQDGVLRLYAFMPMFGDIDKGNAYLVLGIPKKAVFANIDRSLTTNAVFLGIVFFLTFAAAWFASERFILRKVKTIIETTRRLAAGDLNARTGRPYGKGELSQLARAFDEMAGSLQTRQAEIIKVNEGLRKERDFSSTLIQSSPAFFVAISAEGKTIMMNDSMLRALGYTLNEIVGTNYLTTFVPASDHEFLSKIFKQLIELRQPTVNENYLLARDGRELLVEWHGAPVFKENGDFDYFFGVGIDITERKKIEEQLRSSREQLRDLAANMRAAIEEEKKLISREIHDELGQMLTGLKMDISWLNKRLPKDQKILFDKTESMVKLIDTLIEAVRRISLELRPRELDDYGLIAAIEWQAQDFENRSGIKCEFISSIEEADLDRDLSLTVFRILQEILTNVARHAKATRVNITLEEEEGNLKLIVEDNGKGIAEDDISNRKSLGILGIRERAHTFGGEVKISGKPGKGTTVILELPLKDKGK